LPLGIELFSSSEGFGRQPEHKSLALFPSGKNSHLWFAGGVLEDSQKTFENL